MADGTGPVTTTIDDGVAVVRFDDGKANVLSHASLEGLGTALDRAERDARAVCLVGREGRLSAGFDLSVMSAGPDAVRGLAGRGGELLMRLFLHPQPVVVAVTGHALAAGALLVLACDVRIGADAPAKIGLNELSIGMPLPLYALELARARLDPRQVTPATLGARIHDPVTAVEAGYLDRVTPAEALVDEAVAEARRLGGYAPAAYAQTKELLRRPIAARVTAAGTADIERFAAAADAAR